MDRTTSSAARAAILASVFHTRRIPFLTAQRLWHPDRPGAGVIPAMEAGVKKANVLIDAATRVELRGGTSAGPGLPTTEHLDIACRDDRGRVLGTIQTIHSSTSSGGKGTRVDGFELVMDDGDRIKFRAEKDRFRTVVTVQTGRNDGTRPSVEERDVRRPRWLR
jgi:hypothetical protein